MSFWKFPGFIPIPDRHFYGKLEEVWSLQGIDTSYPASFLPVESIAGRSTLHLSKMKDDLLIKKVTTVIPLCTVVGS